MSADTGHRLGSVLIKGMFASHQSDLPLRDSGTTVLTRTASAIQNVCYTSMLGQVILNNKYPRGGVMALL